MVAFICIPTRERGNEAYCVILYEVPESSFFMDTVTACSMTTFGDWIPAFAGMTRVLGMTRAY